MKFSPKLSLALAVGILSVAACSSNKQSKNYYPQYASKSQTTPAPNSGKDRMAKEELDECEEAALNAPASEWRAVGSGVSSDRDFSRQKATLFAKNALVQNLESWVTSFIKGYRADIGAGNKVVNEQMVKEDINSMAEMMVNNCRIVCSNRYKLRDGNFETVVCISIPSDQVKKVVEAAVLSEDARANVEHNAKAFEDSYASRLEKFRSLQNQRN